MVESPRAHVRWRREVVVPPFAFAMVEEGVYRCAQPTLKNYRFLARLKLRCLVAITPEGPVRDERAFCSTEGAELVHLAADRYRDAQVTLTHHQVAQALSLLVDPKRLPALIHCPDGRALSGVVVGCLRKLQCWSHSAAVAEMRRHCPGIPRQVEKFVQDYSDEVVIPQDIPPWLWGGQRAHMHPTVRVRHVPPLQKPAQQGGAVRQHMREEMRQTLAHARADNLRMRRGHMHMHYHGHSHGSGGGAGTGGFGQGGGGAGGGSGSSNFRGEAAAASRGGGGRSTTLLETPLTWAVLPASRDNNLEDTRPEAMLQHMAGPDGLPLPPAALSRTVQALSLAGLEPGLLDDEDEEDDHAATQGGPPAPANRAGKAPG